jgi:hypothetical protein
MLKGGRGGQVRLKLFLSYLWMQTDELGVALAYPAQVWAQLLGLGRPDDAGARRIHEAQAWLERNDFITVQGRAGHANRITVLNETGTGEPYTAPGAAVSRGGGDKSKHLYVQIPASLWTSGYLAMLTGSGLALYLILLDQYGPGQLADNPDPVWFSPKLFTERYALSEDTRAKGIKDLRDFGLVTIKRQAINPGDFDLERIRNVYSLQPAVLDTPAVRRKQITEDASALSVPPAASVGSATWLAASIQTPAWAEAAKLAASIQTPAWAETAKLAATLQTPAWAENAAKLAGLMQTPKWAENAAKLMATVQAPAWVDNAAKLAGLMQTPKWAENTVKLAGLMQASAWAENAVKLAGALQTPAWAENAVKLAGLMQTPVWAENAVKLAGLMQTPAWAENAAKLAAALQTPAWKDSTLQLAASMQTPAWAEAAKLAASMQTPAWLETAAQLSDIANTSPWAESVSSLTAVLGDSAWLEAFAAAAGVEIELDTSEGLPSEVPAEPLDRRRKRGDLLTVAIYLAAAVALHLSNYATTPDPVFDPHQFITDEFLAIGLALAFYCAFWKD